MYSIYGALFFVGLLLASFAFWHFQQTKKLLSNGIKTQAEVVELIQWENSDGNTLYKPVFEYVDTFNHTHQFKSSVSSNPPTYSVNNLVTIVYDPNDLQNVKIITFWDLYRSFVFILCLAAPLIIIGGCYILYEKGML
jgi:hypothetical protein